MHVSPLNIATPDQIWNIKKAVCKKLRASTLLPQANVSKNTNNTVEGGNVKFPVCPSRECFLGMPWHENGSPLITRCGSSSPGGTCRTSGRSRQWRRDRRTARCHRWRTQRQTVGRHRPLWKGTGWELLRKDRNGNHLRTVINDTVINDTDTVVNDTHSYQWLTHSYQWH